MRAKFGDIGFVRGNMLCISGSIALMKGSKGVSSELVLSDSLQR